MKIIIDIKNVVICSNCKVANTFFTRLRGLMFENQLGKNEGLYLKNCNSIHMFFMKFPIDAVFVDRNGVVVHFLKTFQPWRISKIITTAADVLELPSGTIEQCNIEIGDHIILSENQVKKYYSF